MLEDVAANEAVVEVVGVVVGVGVVDDVAAACEEFLDAVGVEGKVVGTGLHGAEQGLYLAPTVAPLVEVDGRVALGAAQEAVEEVFGGYLALTHEAQVDTHVVARAARGLVVGSAEGGVLLQLALQVGSRLGAVEGQVVRTEDVLETELVDVAEVGGGIGLHVALQSLAAILLCKGLRDKSHRQQYD